MKKIKFFFVIVLLVFTTGNFVSAANPYFNYNFINDSYASGEFYSSSILLEIHTGIDAKCKWNTLSNFNFDNAGNNFDTDFGGDSKKTITGLEDGVYDYYVKCAKNTSDTDNLTELKINFLVDSPVTGQIVLSDSNPLKAGRVEVTLVTSKPVFPVPNLRYSFDGIVYNPLTLVGSENTWKGYLVIDNDIKEGLVSFKLEATDLSGRTGTEITSGAVYAIDTIKPSTVSAINANGYNGEIQLKWHLNEDFDHFNIYRSESSGVSYTDFYASNNDETYIDTSVVTGKTYYYKVSAVDDAGNEGDLSVEVYATPSSTNDTNILLGLSLNLRGEVDSLLNEIDFAKSEVEEINSAISLKPETEKKLFADLKFNSKVTKSINDLNSLKNDVEKFKQQDLTKESLDKKISSARLKIDVIKKGIPEDITILKEDSEKKTTFDEDEMRTSILELQPLFDENQIKNSVESSLKMMKDRGGLEINSNFYVVEVVYSDGSKKRLSIINRNLNSKLDKGAGGYFVESIPKDVVDAASNINVGNQDYNVVKEDPVLSFGSDTKNIFYSFEGDLEIDKIKEITSNYVLPVVEEDTGNSITGYFFYNLGNKKYTWFVFGGILFLCIIGYLFYKRRNNFSDSYFNLLRKIKEIIESFDKNSLESLEKEYTLIKIKYSSLSAEEKASIYPKISFLKDKIFVMQLEQGFIELRKTWDRSLFLKLEKIYNVLSEKYKKKLEKDFLKVKNDVEIKDLMKQGKLNIDKSQKNSNVAGGENEGK